MIIGRITNRFQASLLHLACSAIIACLVLAIVFGLWYPKPLAAATGVTEIFLLLLLVDVCLGPLLTAIVFNTKKRELHRDLLIILFIQLAALGYGMYTVAAARPAYMVFEIDRFQLILANDLDAEKLAAVSNKEFKSIPWLGPKWASTNLPSDVKERNKLLFQSTQGGDDLAQIPKFYVDYFDTKEKILEKSKPLSDLRQFNTSNIKHYDELIERYSSNNTQYSYLPLSAKMGDLAVIINNITAEPVEIIELQPW